MEELRKAELNKELAEFEKQGVRFSVNGRPIESDEGLVDLLLADDNCTYMRNYVFQGEKIVEINFDKIKLNKR